MLITFACGLRSLAGGSPAATYLFCFAKKGKPKKASALPQSLRDSQLCETKNGKHPKLATLKQRMLLFPFSVPHNWLGKSWENQHRQQCWIDGNAVEITQSLNIGIYQI
jgi:hypothetical protein